MRVLCLTHVPYEGPVSIAEWATLRGHELEVRPAVTGEFPHAGGVDMLVVMGGPMSAADDAGNPWLAPERAFIARVVEAGGLVLGVCLGSQVLAAALGGSVRRGAELEIGWYPVRLTPAGRASHVLGGWPSEFVAGHWHGDTFDLPAGIGPAASSEVTPNQAFVAFDGRVVGLQFHLEWTRDALAELVAECPGDLTSPAAWVSGPKGLLDDPAHFERSRDLLFALLDAMEARRR